MKQDYQEQILNTSGSLELATAQYQTLHEEVIRNRSDATTSLVKMMSALSRMSISKAYEVAGFESFGDYAEKAANIKERQAYNYVKVYKEFGEEYLKENAQLGVTKLLLLATAQEAQRVEIAENHDIENESVKDLKAALAIKDDDINNAQCVIEDMRAQLVDRNESVKELKKRLEDAKNVDGESDAKNAELELMKKQIEELQKQRDEADAARVVAEEASREASEVSASEIEKEIETVYIEDDESKKKLADTTAELNKVRSELEGTRTLTDSKVKAAESLLQAKLVESEAAANEKLAAAESALAEKQAEAEKLIKKLEIAKDEVMSRFAIKIEDLQNVASECEELINKMNDSTKAEKCRNAIRVALGRFINEQN